MDYDFLRIEIQLKKDKLNYIVPKQTLKNQNGGKDLPESVLPSLLDIISAYGDLMKDYQLHGTPVTDENLKAIDKP